MELPSPSSIEEFWGNAEAIDNIKDFLNSTDVCLLLIGPSGSGKSTLCRLLLDQRKYNVYRPNYEMFQNHKEFSSCIDNFINTRSIDELINNKYKFLFFDDVDALFNTNRYANSYIQDMIQDIKKSKHSVKLILTCCCGMEKKVAEIKRKVKCIYLSNAPCDNILQYINSHTVCKYTTTQIVDFIQNYNCNVRNCLLNIDHLANEIVNKNQSKYKLIFDQNILDIAKNILSVKIWNLKDLELWLSTDPNLLAYIMFDNSNVPKKTAKMTEAILKAYSTSSVFEHYIYAKNDWVLSDVCNLYRCGMIKNCLNGEFFGSKKVSYTTIPTRCSNYFCTLKKNSTVSTESWLSRRDMITVMEHSAFHHDTCNSFTKKIMNVKIPRFRNK